MHIPRSITKSLLLRIPLFYSLTQAILYVYMSLQLCTKHLKIYASSDNLSSTFLASCLHMPGKRLAAASSKYLDSPQSFNKCKYSDENVKQTNAHMPYNCTGRWSG